MKEKNDETPQTQCSEVLKSAQEEKLAEQEIYKGAIEEKNKQLALYQDQLLRTKAEFENYRKRIERERKEYLAWGKEDIILKLIALVDVFEQARQQASSTRNIEAVSQGLELLHKEFEAFLKSEGVQRIETQNKKFDPNEHEAIGFDERESGEDNTVVEEFQKGFRYNNRVIRPARVKVLKIKTEKNESKQEKEASKQEKDEK